MAHLNANQEDATRLGDLDPEDSDLETVETFVEACQADGTSTFDWQHLALLAWNLRKQRHQVRIELEGYGLRFVERPQVKRVRTVSSNPHDRWHGNPCGGGSGWEQITGFAGPPG